MVASVNIHKLGEKSTADPVGDKSSHADVEIGETAKAEAPAVRTFHSDHIHAARAFL